MKKSLMLALVVMASAAFTPAIAQSKKEKKQKKQKTEQRAAEKNCCKDKKACGKKDGEACCKELKLNTTGDSLSYAVGMNMTEGLDMYLSQNFGVDASQMDEVMRGYKHGLAKKDDPAYKAFIAGVQVANMVNERMLPAKEGEYKYAKDTINAVMFHQGFMAAMSHGNTLMEKDKAKDFEAGLRAEAKKAAAEAMKAEGKAFLEENAKKEGVVTLPSGLQYKVLREGNGAIPKLDDNVVVKYEGTLIDGTKFDSSYDRNPQTTTFKPTQVIKGWTEALTMMPVGSKWMLFIPENLAYGERQAGKIPAYSTLIFTVELEEIK